MTPTSSTERIAVLMASHNRRERTLSCLRSLFSQEDRPCLDVFLVDDGSSDGTSESVGEEFPDVRILAGSGDLYWSGGMRLAHRAAAASDPELLLWLNDDVELRPDALKTLVVTHRSLARAGHGRAIVVGAVCDPDNQATTYSGVVRNSRWRRTQFSPLEPSDQPQRCEAMHGNVVLVPRAVYRLVGNFDTAFTHAISDFDYGLRALRRGCEVWLAPGHVGSCRRNQLEGTWLDSRLTAQVRLEKLCSHHGLPPREWWVFTRRHAGKAWPLFWASPYLRLMAQLAAASVGRRFGTVRN